MTVRFLQMGLAISCLLAGWVTAPAFARENPPSTSPQAIDAIGPIDVSHDATHSNATPFPMVVGSNHSSLNFDLGGSETRKLQLQLDQPLTLGLGTRAVVQEGGGNLLGLDATLDLPLYNGFGVGIGANRRMGQAKFQPVGSIHCMNGILRPDSYTASGCRFVDQSFASTESQRFNIGAQYSGAQTSASISWFTQDSQFSQPNVRQLNRMGGTAVMADSLLTPGLGNSLLFGPGHDETPANLGNEASGVDLNFQLGITTDTRGDLRLGLAFTHVLDAGYQGIYSTGADPLSWTLAEPFNSARMNLEWSRGAFSTGIQGFYRDSVDFLDRNSVDGLTTFDVHFTWRTPWNANLSIGASNVMSAGVDESTSNEGTPVDPLESIYGRIPYVRYKQDL